MAAPDGQVGELAERLRALGAEPSARELAEALWLARYVSPAAMSAGRSGDGEPGGGGGEPDSRPPHSAPGTPDTAPAPLDAAPTRLHAERPDPDGPRPAGTGPADPDAVRVRVPMATALPYPLGLQRALRPLQHYRPPVRAAALHLDEQATAEQAAETRLLLPVLRATTRRESRLRLLMDVSTSTGVWETALDELHRICSGLGAFREVTVHHLREGDDGELVAATSRDGERALRAAEQLRDPTGRQLTLVLSDCAGPLWRSGRMQRLLHHWGRVAPVAVVQPLPQRMWRRTHLPALPGTLRRREGLGARLDFVPADGATAPAGALPVPVLAPTRTALGTWARLLSGSTGLALPAAAAWVRADHPAAPSRPARPGADGETAVRAFRRTASRPAVHLAASFSAIPLTLPVMQLVQRAMQPRSGPEVLAEVLLSGLLERGPQDGWYAFRPGVREALLRHLPRGDALLVRKHCGEYVDRHFGRRERNFPALARTGPGDRQALLPSGGTELLAEAFAEVSGLVAERFGTAVPHDAGRSGTVDLVYVRDDEAWGAWAARVLLAAGQPVRRHVLETPRGLPRWLGSWQPAAPGDRAALLIGSWYADLPGDSALWEEIVTRELVPFTLMRVAADSWVADLGVVTRLWDTTAVDAGRRLLNGLGAELSAASVSAAGNLPVSRLRLRHGVPAPGPSPLPEGTLLRRLADTLSRDRRDAVCVLSGPPGTGKTEAAAEYARRHQDAYDIVWWVGESQGGRRERLARLGVELGLSAEGSVFTRLRELARVLRETALRWLIVIDGWDDADVPDYLPSGGHVLITSERTEWPAGFVVQPVKPPSSGWGDVRHEYVERGLVRLAVGEQALGTGFLLADGFVVTAAAVLERLPPGADPTDITATTPWHHRYELLSTTTAGFLTLCRVTSSPVVHTLRLTDRPDTRPEDALVCAALGEGRALSSAGWSVRSEGAPGGTLMRLTGEPLAPECVGGPVLSRHDGAVVGVVVSNVTDDGHAGVAVRIETLRNLRPHAGDGGGWHGLVATHDRDQARIRHRVAPPVSEKTVLYAILARLEPPSDPDVVVRLLPRDDVPAPDHPPHSWRDGAGHLYALASEADVVLYALWILVYLGNRSPAFFSSSERTDLRAWIERMAPVTLSSEQQRYVARTLEREDVPTGCRITLDITPGDEGHFWRLRAVQDGSPLHQATGSAQLLAEGAPALGLERALKAAVDAADTSRRRPTVEYRLPEDLLWDVAVESWTPALALRAECNVFVRGPGPRRVSHQSQGPERWDAVRSGSLRALRAPSARPPRPRPPDVPALLRDAPAEAVPLWCRHAALGKEALDRARSLGYPLMVWSRAEHHQDCAAAHRAVELELTRSTSVKEFLARMRGLWIRQVFSPRGGGWVKHLTVYYDPPEEGLDGVLRP
ncbi:SAV_2336 N-terminal domain-related protein [Streptomyces sp. NPDC032940]|uniref:SAV_2336 N-terminal domain-related protein n=1 Tax=Streptomyces sp. NPDC032940 TaxID=3155366 RepID=UPI0033F5AF70